MKNHGDLFSGKFEASAVGNSLGGDRIAWPLGIDAGNLEPLAAGAELTAEVARLQAVVFGQELEPVLFEIECRTVGVGNADTEYGLEGEAGVTWHLMMRLPSQQSHMFRAALNLRTSS